MDSPGSSLGFPGASLGSPGSSLGSPGSSPGYPGELSGLSWEVSGLPREVLEASGRIWSHLGGLGSKKMNTSQLELNCSMNNNNNFTNCF